MRDKTLTNCLRAAVLPIILIILVCGNMHAQSEELLLFSFDFNDGFFPATGLALAKNGALFGTSGGYTCGNVFQLKVENGAWVEKTVHSFPKHGAKGCEPNGTVVLDNAGNLYGTTSGGGEYNGGTVFELSPERNGLWKEKILHSFSATDPGGSYLAAGVIFDAEGNLYGTTEVGAANNQGSVYELTPGAGGVWTEKVLHSFSNDGADAYNASGSLTLDGTGNLYGTSSNGGTDGGGTVFELSPQSNGNWTEAVIWNFATDNTDGFYPLGGVAINAAGSLFGTTLVGGTYGMGTVFELIKAASGGWQESVLHAFSGYPNDGQNSYSPLTFDPKGNLFGTTYAGGTNGNGTVFEVSLSASGNWTESVVYSFGRVPVDGNNPQAGLVRGSSGNFYGTTYYGGSLGDGCVFEVRPLSE
jgi:uncharacterized repeat protein (TIGR03803 family)